MFFPEQMWHLCEKQWHFPCLCHSVQHFTLKEKSGMFSILVHKCQTSMCIYSVAREEHLFQWSGVKVGLGIGAWGIFISELYGAGSCQAPYPPYLNQLHSPSWRGWWTWNFQFLISPSIKLSSPHYHISLQLLFFQKVLMKIQQQIFLKICMLVCSAPNIIQLCMLFFFPPTNICILCTLPLLCAFLQTLFGWRLALQNSEKFCISVHR